MEIYVSINGVLRNLIQKFDYHYKDYFLEIETDEEGKEDNFEYRVNYPIQNDDILNYFTFHSKEEFESFLFIEFPLEIFGHAGISYSTAISDLNRLIYENKNLNFTVVGIDELGRAKPSTLFFLSKNQFLGNNIKFITSKDIDKEWKKCDLWVTDSKEILDSCPKNKIAVKFNTDYNQTFASSIEINELTKINELCLRFSEKTTLSTLTKSFKNAIQSIRTKFPTK